MHTTVRGFDGTGRLTFTCHLSKSMRRRADKAWMYRTVGDRNETIVGRSRYGARVETKVRVMGPRMSFLLQEWVPVVL
jgi:hypothetical protein